MYQDSRVREVEAEDRGHSVVFTLSNLTAREEGDYTCVLTNTAGEGRTSQATSVLVLSRPTLRLEVAGGSTDSLVVVETSPSPANITLSCSLQSVEQTVEQRVSHYHWYLDTILLHTLPHCPSSTLCHIDPTKLLLENVNRHFHGNFSCAGSLSSGQRTEMSNPLSVSVLFPPGPASIAVSSSSALYAGDNVTFTCSLQHQGRPGTEGFRWRLGGREVREVRGGRLSVSLTDSRHNNVSCQGYNQAGDGQPALLDVEVMTGPRLVHSLPPRTLLREDQALQLVCQVVCHPVCELRWYREGRLVKHSDRRFSINKTISYQNKRKYYR